MGDYAITDAWTKTSHIPFAIKFPHKVLSVNTSIKVDVVKDLNTSLYIDSIYEEGFDIIADCIVDRGQQGDGARIKVSYIAIGY